MFEKLKEYAEKVDSGLIVRDVNIEPYSTIKLSPENDAYENLMKRDEIKNFIESHMHGVTVKVSGGQKFPSDNKRRRPITIRTFKNNEPLEYNEINIAGIYMDEKNSAIIVYEKYLSFLIGYSEHIKTGKISIWEHFIAQWLNDNFFYESGYCCEDNSLFKINEEESRYEIIILDIKKEVAGVVIDSRNDELALVIICNEKQVLIDYNNYYIKQMD